MAAARVLAVLLLITTTAGRGVAQPVDVALVLAMDVSGSVNQRRFELQREGYAAAFRDAGVRAAIRRGGLRAIAICMVQWTGPGMNVPILAWRRVDDAASAEAAAIAIEAAPRRLFGGGTSLTEAIAASLAQFAALPFEASRQVIDISGDGANNRGDPPDEIRDAAVARGITINGLAIPWLEPDLEDYYRAHVIGGPRAFVVTADDYESFAEAIRRKLITEIALLPVAREPLESPDTARR